ncbi:uncharacterized protein LOC129905021 [Solanum dulcamara]|uniref:uncharacterized protein LOC129905021 n=1 Tax=Solanum dulcamara TaxID=45834 RepID=UPI00248612A2|nr:uncharacterized protein LOC129905021 [Solanum dulcamara]
MAQHGTNPFFNGPGTGPALTSARPLAGWAYRVKIESTRPKLGLVVFSPGENNVFAWPSVTQAKEIVRKYLAAIQKSNPVKLVRHDNFLQSIVDNQAKYITKIEKIAEEKEMESLFNQLVGARIRFDELDVRELKGLLKLFGVRRAKLEERKKQLNENVGNEIDPNDNNDG